MAKETKELIQLVDRVPEIEQLFAADPSFPTVQTINGSVDFKIWAAELKRELLKLKQEGLVAETVTLLTNRFKNGFTDRSDFNTLKANLFTISKSIDEYLPAPPTPSKLKGKITPIYGKLAKGQIVYTTFSQYELIKQIGSGGNGRVFSAKDPDGSEFAIKFVDKYQSSTKLKRFKNEINFCERHKHKNIVPILDRGQAFLDDKDLVFYVMPLYSETLKDKIKAGIPHKDVLDIFIGLLEGLKFSHEHGSIHRDIKPENIMFAKGSLEPIICDYGIAHFAEEDLLTIVETKATDRMANFQYAAPEQRKRGGNICFQTDIYALALILNEMFTGEIPQAAGHKRIADINSEYKYLDDLFDLLFKQDPNERLYPEDTILSELKILAEQHKRHEETERLKAIINELVVPEEFNPSIINLEFVNNGIHFVFDTVLPGDWFQTLVYGSYSHACQMGYDTNKLKKVNNNTISMPIRGNESADTIKTIVANVKDWVATVSKQYSQEAKRQAIAEQRRKEEARIAEIKRLEKEAEMSVSVNAVLKGLL